MHSNVFASVHTDDIASLVEAKEVGQEEEEGEIPEHGEKFSSRWIRDDDTSELNALRVSSPQYFIIRILWYDKTE